MNTRIPDADGTHRLGGSGDYLAPATADPATERREAIDVAGHYGFTEPRRYDAVTVTRAELGVAEPSPIRAYLTRHAAEALVERQHAETRLEDATRDFQTAVERQAMIQRALDDLDQLEADHRRISRMIVGPERRGTH